MEAQILVPYKVGLNQEQNVLIDLGVATRFMVLDPGEAIQLAEWLVKHAKKSLKFKEH